MTRSTYTIWIGLSETSGSRPKHGGGSVDALDGDAVCPAGYSRSSDGIILAECGVSDNFNLASSPFSGRESLQMHDLPKIEPMKLSLRAEPFDNPD